MTSGYLISFYLVYDLYDFDETTITLLHISYIIFLILALINLLSNPGIPERKYYIKNIKINKSNHYLKCKKCNIIVPKTLDINHCNYCDICVLNSEHHSHWTGKCIGKGNYFLYIVFILSTFTLILISSYCVILYFADFI